MLPCRLWLFSSLFYCATVYGAACAAKYSSIPSEESAPRGEGSAPTEEQKTWGSQGLTATSPQPVEWTLPISSKSKSVNSPWSSIQTGYWTAPTSSSLKSSNNNWRSIETSYWTWPTSSSPDSTSSAWSSRTCYPQPDGNHGSTVTLTSTKPIITSTITVRTTITSSNTVSGQSASASAVITITQTSTQIVTSASSVQATVTSSTTSTTTTTITSPVATSTSVVPTPDGFVPVYDSSGDSNPPASKKKTKRGSRSVGDRVLTPRLVQKNIARALELATCIDYVQPVTTETTTLTITTTISSQPTTVSVISTTSTVTTTVFVTSTTITSLLATSTSISTITTTSSTTLYVSTTTTTSYAACATNNIIGPQIQNGEYIVGASGPDGSIGNLADGITTAYDCCVFCINTPNCLGTDFSFSNVPGNVFTQCEYYTVATGGTCNQASNQNAFVVATSQTNGDNIVISNGRCGEYSPPLDIGSL